MHYIYYIYIYINIIYKINFYFMIRKKLSQRKTEDKNHSQ